MRCDQLLEVESGDIADRGERVCAVPADDIAGIQVALSSPINANAPLMAPVRRPTHPPVARPRAAARGRPHAGWLRSS